jgi:hypothetical protein
MLAGVLAFPQPNIAAAVEHIDERGRDLLKPLIEMIARILPLGSAPASMVAPVLFRYVAPEVKVGLYRRLVLRFVAQLGALFVRAALCFYLSILGVPRRDFPVQPVRRARDKHHALPARSDAVLRAVRFYGAHPSLDFACHHQSARHRIRVLHLAMSHVHCCLSHFLALQGPSVRCAAVARAASLARAGNVGPRQHIRVNTGGHRGFSAQDIQFCYRKPARMLEAGSPRRAVARGGRGSASPSQGERQARRLSYRKISVRLKHAGLLERAWRAVQSRSGSRHDRRTVAQATPAERHGLINCTTTVSHRGPRSAATSVTAIAPFGAAHTIAA